MTGGSTRPMFKFSIFFGWQAKAGVDAVGPVRVFMIDALEDLPAGAKLTVNFDRQTYSCDDAFRVAPVHTPIGGIFGGSRNFVRRDPL